MSRISDYFGKKTGLAKDKSTEPALMLGKRKARDEFEISTNYQQASSTDRNLNLGNNRPIISEEEMTAARVLSKMIV